ncbi:MAG: ABC transporter permease [Gemmatimonadetes bacterium]|nr:ABC transporter permease [Gemmatimonadota bacterium]
MLGRDPRPTASERLLRALLLAYPRRFRDRFGRGLIDGLHEDLRAARRSGRLATGRFWIAAARDAVIHGVLERIAPSARRARHSTLPITPGHLELRVTHLSQDVRFALRSLWRARVSSLVSVTTLGVGIGATTAIFTVVDTVVLEPLPYPESDALVAVYRTSETSDRGAAAAPDVRDWDELVTSFQDVGAWTEIASDFEEGEGVVQLPGSRLSAGMLRTLGVSPALGRWFTEDEDRIGGPDVILLGHAMWRDRFGADPDLVGRTILRNGDPHTVLGVMPEGFRFPTPETEHWVPLRDDELLRLAGIENPGRGLGFLNTVARLAPGVGLDAARAELQRVTAGIDAEHPETASTGATLVSLHEATVGEVKSTLFTFLAAVAIVLLISCANVANLAIARSSARSTEMSVRSALGAARARLVQLLLTESALVGLAAGGLGILFALGLTGLLTSMSGDTIPRGYAIELDGSVLAFAAALSLATGLLFGLFAAVSASRPRISEGLKEGGRGGSSGRATSFLRSGLVVAQVAMALALMTGAGLLINSYYRLTQVDAGFEHENVLTARVTLPPDRYESDAQVLAFFDGLTERVEGLPGVTAVTTSYSPPLAQSDFEQTIAAEDWASADQEDGVWAGTVIVGDEFFEASGVPITRGRDFDRTDRAGSPVAVVNETMADRLWPGEDALGKRFRVTGGISGTIESLARRFFPDGWITVVGVAGDVRRESLETEPRPEFYRPHAQMAWPGSAVLVRTTSDPLSLVEALKREVRALDRGLAVTSIHSLRGLVDASTAGPRFRTTLLLTFAVIASFLAMIGVYGVMAFSVGERRREIGVRMALGASGGRVRKDVVFGGLRMSIVGVAVGLVGAVIGSRALSAMVFGISTQDPWTYGVVALLVLAVALAASYVPALRASRIDPTHVLRES